MNRRRYRSVALAASLAALASWSCLVGGLGPPPSEVRPGEVAFELAGPGGAALVVPVRINGTGPYDFVLDTGATVTSVDPQLAERLALPDVTGTIGYGGGIGGAGQVRLVEIDSLEVGTARATDLTGAVVDLAGVRSAGLDVDGLVGLNFLRSYRVTLDFERNALRLDAPQPAR